LALSGEINIWMCIIEFAAKSKYPDGMNFVRPKRGYWQVLLLVMLEQMATNAHIIAVFNPINDTLSWEHI
jgi:hypothetical protein